jgi:hypothetical protein
MNCEHIEVDWEPAEMENDPKGQAELIQSGVCRDCEAAVKLVARQEVRLADWQESSDSDAIHYNERFRQDLRISTEEAIASYLFAETGTTEAKDMARSILAIVLHVFRPDLFERGKPHPDPDDAPKPKWRLEYATTGHAASEDEALDLGQLDVAQGNCVERATRLEP